jgi:hypothetical protein
MTDQKIVKETIFKPPLFLLRKEKGQVAPKRKIVKAI